MVDINVFSFTDEETELQAGWFMDKIISVPSAALIMLREGRDGISFSFTASPSVPTTDMAAEWALSEHWWKNELE